MEEELISVIVPVYNVEKYLQRCINSLINQTYKNLEIILINDGSEDKSGELCDKYKNIDPRIKVIHKKNQGLGFARNTGLENATGKYISFIDSDDYIKENMLEKMYKYIKSDKSDTVLCNICDIEEEAICIKEDISNNVLLRMIGANYSGKNYIGMSVWRGLYSKEIIEDNNIRFYSEREYISEDIIFDFNYYRYSKRVTLLKDYLYIYCTNNESSLTKKYKNNRFQMYKKLYIKEKELINSLNLCEEANERLNNTFYWNILVCLKQEIKYKPNGYKKNIKKILEDKTLVKVLSEIDDSKMNFKNRLFVNMIRKRRKFIIRLILKIKGD